MKKLLLTISILIVIQFGIKAQTIVYVDKDATGQDDGSSWTNAYNNLEDATNVASSNTEIWVAEGTYYPTSGTARGLDFQILASDMSVYGGFNGTETMRSERDWRKNQTILSGDIGTKGDNTDNSQTVLRISASSREVNMIFDGFIVEDGYAEGSYNSSVGSGAAIYVGGYADSVHINNVIFRNNSASSGAGIFCYPTQKTFLDITNCEFYDNIGLTFASGFDFLVKDGDSLEVNMVNCLFHDNITDTTNLIGGSLGRAITWLNNAYLKVNILNSTFADNTGSSTEELIIVGSLVNPSEISDETINVQNCIFWNNLASEIFDHHSNYDTPDSMYVGRCVTDLPFTKAYISDTLIYDTDPLFTNATGDDYSIRMTSPALNTGSTINFSDIIPATDLAGNPRIASNGIDMGCYERQCLIDEQITKSGNTLTSSHTGVSYQWIDCSDNTEIAGETNQSFTATASGSYACVLDNGTCSVTSICKTITIAGTSELLVKEILIYPNPATNQLYIRSEQPVHSVQIMDVSGRIVKEHINPLTSVSIHELPAGMYSIAIQTRTERVYRKFIKK